MKPIAAFCLALFGTTTLAAQTPMTQVIPPRGAASMEGVGTVTTYNSETHQTTTVVVQVPQAASCPVSVRAQQFSAAANMMEADSNRPKGMAQSLHLALAKPNSDRIT